MELSEFEKGKMEKNATFLAFAITIFLILLLVALFSYSYLSKDNFSKTNKNRAEQLIEEVTVKDILDSTGGQ